MRTLQRVPAGFFGMVLGVFGLGSAWRYAASIGLAPRWVGEVGVLAGCAVWLTLALVYAYRCVTARERVLAEWRDPGQFAFISLLPAGAVLVSAGLRPSVPVVADVLLVAGTVGQLTFSAVRCAPLWRGTQPLDATTPGFYLPTVAANFICAIALGQAGHTELGYMFLGAGLVSWLTLEPLVTHRLRTGPELPPRARAVVGVQLAPAFVACYAYLSVNGGRFDPFALALFGYGLLQLLLLGRLVPWFFQGGFSPGLWAFSFGLAALANCALRLDHATGSAGLRALAVALVALSTVLLLGLVVQTLVLLARGRLVPPDAPHAGAADRSPEHEVPGGTAPVEVTPAAGGPS